VASPPGWLLSPKLAQSRWLTSSVKMVMQDHLQFARQMESQTVIDAEIARWARQAYGEKAQNDPQLMAQLKKAFAKTQNSRFDDWLAPLSIDNSYAHIPPATMVPHSDAGVTPYIASIPGEDGEGRLIMIDPLNHIFLTPMCCALLIVACYDLDREQLIKVLDFVLVTASYFSGHREKTEALLNNLHWNDLSEKLMHIDDGIGSIAELMSFNMLAFAFYHEVSHSLLGHVGPDCQATVAMVGYPQRLGVFTAQQQQELDADAHGAKLFEALLRLSRSGKMDWTGERYDHAPLALFRVMALLEKVKTKLTGRDFDSATHPHPMRRLEELKCRYAPSSASGVEAFKRLTSALDRVEFIVGSLDLRAHLRNMHFLTRHRADEF
jgi:hypothetical protein